MKQVFHYCLKVWLTAVVIAPVLWLIFGAVLTKRVEFSFSPIWMIAQFFGYIIYMIIFGFIVSVPSFFLIFLLAVLLNKWFGSQKLFKSILTFFGVIFSLIPLLAIKLADTTVPGNMLVIYSSYPIMIVAGIWYFKFNSLLPAAKF